MKNIKFQFFLTCMMALLSVLPAAKAQDHDFSNMEKEYPLLMQRYGDRLVYLVLPIAEMDYYDLNPTPPVFKHFDLISGEVSNGFVGDRFSKVTI